MKKVKLMLTAVVIMAVVGGAFAFKVKKGAPKKCLFSTTSTTTSPDGITKGTCNYVGLLSVAGFATTSDSIYISTKDPIIEGEITICRIVDNFNQPFKDCTLWSTTIDE